MGIRDLKQDAERVSGVSNIAYDLMSVLQNTLEGISAIEVYRQDALEVGDDEAGQLLSEIQQRLIGDVDRLKSMLLERLQQ